MEFTEATAYSTRMTISGYVIAVLYPIWDLVVICLPSMVKYEVSYKLYIKVHHINIASGKTQINSCVLWSWVAMATI